MANEIDGYRQRLIDIKKMSDAGERNKAYIDLEAELGASGCGKDMSVGERDAEHVRSINQALQTLTMIDMCKTAREGYDMATNISRKSSICFWLASAIALLSAVAAWVAALRN
ncbi:MAG: hypothetical protein FVQ82_04660 [Planctomycetes bacterium]|nr:hypothetical protein [Planctomycetota bacterium]